jgi:nicotinamidase-related amidase
VKTALVLIDLQTRIVELDLAPHAGALVVDRCRRLASGYRAAGRPVVVVQTERPGVERQPAGSELVGDFLQPSDILLTKRTMGAFANPELDNELRSRQVTALVIAGLVTNFGVESAVRAASDLGYEVTLVHDAMSGRTIEEHNFAVERIFPVLARSLRPTRCFRRSLRVPPRHGGGHDLLSAGSPRGVPPYLRRAQRRTVAQVSASRTMERQGPALISRLVGSDEWDKFADIPSARSIVAGLGNMDEIRFPKKGPYRMHLRLFDPQRDDDCSIWSSTLTGRLEPPVVERFEAGIGDFFGDDQHAGTASVFTIGGPISPAMVHAGSRPSRQTAARHGKPTESWTSSSWSPRSCRSGTLQGDL